MKRCSSKIKPISCVWLIFSYYSKNKVVPNMLFLDQWLFNKFILVLPMEVVIIIDNWKDNMCVSTNPMSEYSRIKRHLTRIWIDTGLRSETWLTLCYQWPITFLDVKKMGSDDSIRSIEEIFIIHIRYLIILSFEWIFFFFISLAALYFTWFF